MLVLKLRCHQDIVLKDVFGEDFLALKAGKCYKTKVDQDGLIIAETEETPQGKPLSNALLRGDDLREFMGMVF